MDNSVFRQPAVAGLFYPEDASALLNEITDLITHAIPPEIPGSAVGLILPHAGYRYSGPTAAFGFRLLEARQFESIIIVAPSHHEYFDGISVYNGDGYETPLGKVPVNKTIRDALVEHDSIISASTLGHGQEHAVEVQIPFLQYIFHGMCSIVPVIMGDQRREYCIHLGKKLSTVCRNANVLLIASSDLSHYHSYHDANALDQIITESVRRFDFTTLMNNLETNRTEACGGGPMAAVMLASSLLGANTITLLHHCNSGDVTGERNSVVGYLSAIITTLN